MSLRFYQARKKKGGEYYKYDDVYLFTIVLLIKCLIYVLHNDKLPIDQVYQSIKLVLVRQFSHNLNELFIIIIHNVHMFFNHQHFFENMNIMKAKKNKI